MKTPPDSRSSFWSDWQLLPGGWQPAPAVLAETLDGGQAFRWFQEEKPSALRSPELVEQGEGGPIVPTSGIWTGQWADCLVQLRGSGDRLEWRAPAALGPRLASALPGYLGADTDWAALTDALPWRSDAHLARCIQAFPHLRLLRQPFGETLLGFLCSATKRIVQIKQMCALLAELHGAPLGWHAASGRFLGASRTPRSTLPLTGNADGSYHRLPTWPELAAIPEKDLRRCLLGFRARFIAETARFLARRPGWLEETEKLPYAAAKERLLELPGVGEKVADCVLLFGAGRLEAFPVDTWVLTALERRYGLAGWKPAQVALFGRTHFGPFAGLAQQYLFAWERKYGER